MLDRTPLSDSEKAAIVRGAYFQVVSVLMSAMSQRRCTFEDVDKTLGEEPGWTRGIIGDMLDCCCPDDALGALAITLEALGFVLRFDVQPREPTPVVNESGGDDAAIS